MTIKQSEQYFSLVIGSFLGVKNTFSATKFFILAHKMLHNARKSDDNVNFIVFRRCHMSSHSENNDKHEHSHKKGTTAKSTKPRIRPSNVSLKYSFMHNTRY